MVWTPTGHPCRTPCVREGTVTCAVGIGSAGGGPGPEAAGSHEREDGPATGIFEFIPERAAGKYDFVRGKRRDTEWLTCYRLEGIT